MLYGNRNGRAGAALGERQQQSPEAGAARGGFTIPRGYLEHYGMGGRKLGGSDGAGDGTEPAASAGWVQQGDGPSYGGAGPVSERSWGCIRVPLARHTRTGGPRMPPDRPSHSLREPVEAV